MKKYIIVGIIIIIAILFLYNKQENITSTDSGKTLSDEALQAIASVYNTQNMIVTNLNATGQTLLKDTKISNNLNVSGTIIGNVTGNITGNVKGDINGGMTDSTGRYRLSIDANGNLIMYDTSVNPWKLMPIGSAGDFSGLFSGQLISDDRNRALVPQNDGNLVLYYTAGKPSSGLAGYGAMWLSGSHA